MVLFVTIETVIGSLVLTAATLTLDVFLVVYHTLDAIQVVHVTSIGI